MTYARTAGARIYYEQRGAGMPVLLLPGTGSDLRQQPSPYSWPECEKFSVLSYDHRDLGRSISHGTETPTMRDYAQDALELVDAVSWSRFAVIGISFGGMVAQDLALLAGARVTSLVLAGTSSGGGGGHSFPLHELLALGQAQRHARYVELLDTRTRTDAGLRAAIAEFVKGDLILAEPPPRGLLQQLEARRNHDCFSRITRLATPTLVVAGRFDGIAPGAVSQSLSAAIPGARLQLFEGGHGFLLQDSAAWPAIAGHIEGASAGSL